MDSFVNLHVHSLHSIQDSVIKIEELIDKVIEYDQSSVAITDHSSCAAWIKFSQCAKEKNIHPIFGNEFYCWQFGESKNSDRDHLVLLAMNQEGMVNIRRFQRLAVNNFYYKPILRYEVLQENPHDGIYATSACFSSTISKYILLNSFDRAANYCEFFYNLFDGNFALELQFHPDFHMQSIVNMGLVKLSEELSIPLTVSSDAHFLDEKDRDLRRIVKAISYNKEYNEIDESLKSNCFGNSELIMKFAKESDFPYMDLVPKAIKQTQKIAKQCKGYIEEPKRHIPIFDKHDELDKLFELQEW